MKISLKILCSALIIGLSFGSLGAMRGGRRNGPRRQGPRVTYRRLPVPTPPQVLFANEDEDFEMAFILQAQEVQKFQEEEKALALSKQIKDDEAYALGLQDGSEEDDESLDSLEDDATGQEDSNEQFVNDMILAQRLQEELNAEEVQQPRVPAPVRNTPQPTPAAVPKGNAPTQTEKAEECSICATNKPSVWMLCCTQSICQACLGEWLAKNNSCPYCRAGNPPRTVLQ